MPAYVQNNGQVASSSTQVQNENSAFVAKDEDTVMGDATIPVAPAPPKPVFFKKYESATEIPYAPEDALKEGLGMVKSIKTSIKTIQLGSKLRQDVWMRELERCGRFTALNITVVLTTLVQSAEPRRSYDTDSCLRW